MIVGAHIEKSSTTGVNSTPNNNLQSGSGAVYVFVRNGNTWTQQAYIKSNNTGNGDSFGYSVALSGDTLVVGDPAEDSSTTGVNSIPNESAFDAGAAYVFMRSGTTWSQQAYIKASNPGANDNFGWSVAVSGDTVIVGAKGEDSLSSGVNSVPNNTGRDHGAAYVFVRSGAFWSQQAFLKASNVSVLASNSGHDDGFGTSVAVAGDTVIVGSPGEDSSSTGVNSESNELAGSSGAAYVFVRSGTTWSHQAYIKASNTGGNDRFGSSVAMSGDTVVIGAPGEYSSTTGVNSTPDDLSPFSGAAYVFVRGNTTWTQQAYLKASNTGMRDADGYNDEFGTAVAVSGDIVVVGACKEDSSSTGVNSTPNEGTTDSGAAYVFVRSGTTWSQQVYLKASNPGATDKFGITVAVSGETVVVGAHFEDSSTTGVNSMPNEFASNSGAAYLFSLPAPPTVSITAISPDPRTAPVSTMIITFSAPVQNFDISDLTLTRDNGPNLINQNFLLTTNDSTVFTLTGTASFTGTGGNYRLAVSISDIVDFGGLPLGSSPPEQWMVLATNNDTDGDGLNDAAEFDMSALGFNWQVSQIALVNTLFSNATRAGLYTPAQVQTLNLGTPLIAKNPTTGKFTLTISVQRTPNLATTPFTDFLFGAPDTSTTINPAGKLEFEFPASGDTEFFRLQAQ